MSQVEEIFVMDIEEEMDTITEADARSQADIRAQVEQNYFEELLLDLQQLLTPEENDIDGNNFTNDEIIQLREDPHMFDLSRIVRQRN